MSITSDIAENYSSEVGAAVAFRRLRSVSYHEISRRSTICKPILQTTLDISESRL